MSAASRIHTELPELEEAPGKKQEPASSALPGVCKEVYYDEATKDYLFPRATGWLRLNETSCKRQLKQNGVSTTRPDGESISPMDYALNFIQLERSVCYAGPLAGHKAGIYDYSGTRVLVTSGPRLIQAKEGDWPTLRSFLEKMFNTDGQDQCTFLYGWLKVALEGLANGNGRPGQALVIAGSAGCGKSLLQNIITELLGGRSAKPYQYMTGETTFNGELFAAEHLMIEDEAASPDVRMRRKFGTEIKGITVNQTNRFHPKGRQAISLRPFWRVSVSLNDEPENLMVLPPIDESLEDKLILLQAKPQQLPTDDLVARDQFWKTLTSELPAFVYWLEQWVIPEDLVSQRFGITHYHHPALLKSILHLSPEMKLWGMIESTVLSEASEWKGTAVQLEARLTDSYSGVSVEARRLLSYYSACGSYLGRLSKHMPLCVIRDRSSSVRGWVIRKPSSDSANT